MFFSKRSRIIISILLVSILLYFIPYVGQSGQYFFLLFITILSYGLTSWSFKQYLYGIKIINLFVLPVLLVTFSGIFLIQIDLSFWLRILFIVTFMIIYYIISLAENIFNVSEVRNIPLLRAANTAGYLSTLGVAFMGFFLIYYSNLTLGLTLLFLAVFSFLIYLQAFWQIELSENLSREVFFSSMVSMIMTTQLGFILSLWPITAIGAALGLTTSIYTFLGLIGHKIKKNINKRASIEYITVGLIVFMITLFTLTH